MFDLSKIFKRSSKKAEQKDTVKEGLTSKYQAFQKLLSTNNQVLELMADMEEKLTGEYLFDIQYIKTNVRLMGYAVLKIIENLNTLSKDKYSSLLEIHTSINQEIEKILEYKMDVLVSELTIPLDDIAGAEVGIAGGKIAHLGEVRNAVRLPTPDGFVISAYAFVKFLDHNRLVERITERLSTLGIENLEELEKVSKEIRDMITGSEIPEDLNRAIGNACARLYKKAGVRRGVSVRSSAIREDSEFSFAGQYATYLNVSEEQIVQRYKEVVASLFTPRAIFYSKTKGFSEADMVMAVGVLLMVDAVAGGVIYTKDPNDPDVDHVLINAVRGLGKLVVDGTVTPDTYMVSRHPEGTIIDKRLSDQEMMLVCGETGTTDMVRVPEELRTRQCLTDKQIRVVTKYALILEEHYGAPQDIEWAVDRNGGVYILQSRPLRTQTRPQASRVCIPTRITGHNVLLDKGVIACKGVGFGQVFIIEDEDDLKNFPPGAVLVAKHTSPKFVTVMNKASAIVTDVGSATGHMASLSREYQVPTVLDTEVATRVLTDGQEITVDAINCNIYEGKVNELIEYARNKREPFKETHLFKTLERVLKQVVPLNLTDPAEDNFRAEYCKTFHDITRFAHEVSMREMFSIGDDHDVSESPTIDLHAGVPVAIHMLDIGGGVREDMKKATVDDVFSIPFLPLLKGMKSMRWPGPPPVDAKGFLGMLAHSASVPEDQLKDTAQKSFAVVSKNYVNFSIRLGYHFSMIEAYAGENINDNYIKFFFKGGGAALDRRLRRIRLITEILKTMGFRVNNKEDVIDAILTKYKQPAIESKLEVMGKLTAYTKQLDMAMFNDAVTDMYIDQFIKEHIQD